MSDSLSDGEKIIKLPGGVLLKSQEGKILGAIGVSGCYDPK